ncbi:MAG: AAA family ATPase [Chloroflexi bacterium]|nr:AAA family ATPase [Chloroflexota bacterium]
MSNHHLPTQSLLSLGEFGERTRQLPTELQEAALVIGLGQVGMQAVVRLHTMLDTLLAPRERQAKTRLLAIAHFRSLRDEYSLPREERLHLDMEPVPWSEVPGRYAQYGVAQWWPYSPRSREVLEDPTQLRAYQRLMLYHNAGLISETLFMLVNNWLYQVGIKRGLNLPRRIYVLASLAEAEGSGMLFDIVSRLRALSRQGPVTIIGVFSLCPTEIGSEKDQIAAMANVYATLREIDSYTLHPETFTSNMPVIGHSPFSGTPQRALDMILLADDAAEPCTEPPQNTLAECVATWIATSLMPPNGHSLPQPVVHDPGEDRFHGYTTFGVSKLALPTRAAMNLASVGLAQAVLEAARTSQIAQPGGAWVSEIVAASRYALFETPLQAAQPVNDKLREWNSTLQPAQLVRALELRTAGNQSSTMSSLIESYLQELDRELASEVTASETGVLERPDTLRSRVDIVLDQQLVPLSDELLASGVDLAYRQGYGLIWTTRVIEMLSAELDRLMPGLEQEVKAAHTAYAEKRQALLGSARDYDARISRFGGSRKTLLADLGTHSQAVLEAALRQVLAEARYAAAAHLLGIIEMLSQQLQTALREVDKISQSLSSLSDSLRRALGEATRQPPSFPTSTLVSEAWYLEGTKDLKNFGQVPPQTLLSQVFEAWSATGDLPSEDAITRFLGSVLDAARQMLRPNFCFQDLYEFIMANAKVKPVQQLLTALPGAATPALAPNRDDRYPPAEPYEFVRAVPRLTQIIRPPVNGIRRVAVPSSDPDEITVFRLLHGLAAETLPPLRELYHRAYDRAGAENVPLHIDRRWDAIMADLVHSTARREITIIWENLMTALQRKPGSSSAPLEALIHAFGNALNAIDLEHDTSYAHYGVSFVTYRLRPFQLKLPPPKCLAIFIYSSNHAPELTEVIYNTVSSAPDARQFAFIVNISGRRDLDVILEQLRTNNFTLLEMRETEVKHLVGARLPTRALTNFILDHVNLMTISPFLTGGPVPENMFYGRQRELNEVRTRLASTSVSLIGGRRIGKTSTLQRLEGNLQLPNAEQIPYYLDCSGVTNYEAFFYALSVRWQIDIDPLKTRPFEFERVLRELQQRTPRRKIAFLLDEVDNLLRFDQHPENKETLFRTFRSLSNEQRCQFVFSGEKWLMRAASDPYSALFNFAKGVRLEPLPPSVVKGLVADPFETLNIWIEGAEEVIGYIYNISAGHPNIVQMLCEAMIRELDREGRNTNLVNLGHLDNALKNHQLKQQIVETIWGQMTPLARLITLVWPDGERFQTLDDLEKLLRDQGVSGVPPELMRRTALDLELYCFVRPQSQGKLELIPMEFPTILSMLMDKTRQIKIDRDKYLANPEDMAVV